MKSEQFKGNKRVSSILSGILFIFLLINLNFLSETNGLIQNTVSLELQEQNNEQPLYINWQEPELLSEPGAETKNYPQVALDSKNNLHVVWEEDYLCYRVFNRRTKTWSDLEVIDDYLDTIWPKIAIDENDGIHLAWIDRGVIEYCHKIGEEWSNPISVVRDRNDSSNGFEIAIDNQLNRIYFVWDEERYSTNNDLFSTYYEIDTQSVSYTRKLNESPYRTTISAIAIDSESRLHVVWDEPYETWDTSEVFYQLLDKYYHEVIPEQVISKVDAVDSEYAKLVVDSNDNPHIVWVNSHHSEYLNISYKRMISDEWQETINFTEEGFAFQPDIFCDINNNIHFFWLEAGSNYTSLDYKQFIDQTQWSVTQRIPYDLGIIYPQIAVEKNGNIHVIFENDSPDWYAEGIIHLFGKLDFIHYHGNTILAVTIPFSMFLLVVLVVLITIKKKN